MGAGGELRGLAYVRVEEKEVNVCKYWDQSISTCVQMQDDIFGPSHFFILDSSFEFLCLTPLLPFFCVLLL